MKENICDHKWKIYNRYQPTEIMNGTPIGTIWEVRYCLKCKTQQARRSHIYDYKTKKFIPTRKHFKFI